MSESLLKQIQLEAVDGSQDLSSLLRKCRILAQRLGNNDLKTWVVKELDGYAPGEEPPAYRIQSDAAIYGDYFGAFDAELRNFRIPSVAIQKESREKITRFVAIKGVGEIQGWIEQSNDGYLRISLDPTIFPFISNLCVRDDMVLGQAVKIINTSFLKGILDAIRNKVLNFTLELESEAPKTGDPIEGLRMQKPETIQNIFNTEIRGDVGNVSVGSVGVTQNASVNKGDVEALRKILQDEIGLNQEEAEEFVEAVKAEAPEKDGVWGKRVATLSGKIFTKAAEGLLKVPATVIASLLTEVLKKYYGFS